MSAGNRWLLSIVATAAAILAYVIILIDRLAAGSRVDPRIHSAILATLTISAILTGGALILWRALAPVWAKLTEMADALAELRAQFERQNLDRRAGRDEDTRDLPRPRGVATIVAVVERRPPPVDPKVVEIGSRLSRRLLEE